MTAVEVNSNISGEYNVLAGQVSRAHGVTGNVRVRLFGQNQSIAASSLEKSGVIRLVPADGGEYRDLTLSSLRPPSQPKALWVAKFKEISHRNEAEEICGHKLFVREGVLPHLPEGEYYVDDLIGMSVVTDTGESLGALTEVLETPANDVYVTEDGAMIPVVSEFVLSVDMDARRITVRDVPGLRQDS